MVVKHRSFIGIKYRKDKRAQGARLCCPDELSNEINLIYADGPDTDIVVILNIDNKVDLMANTQQIPAFELTYESDEAKIVPSDDCLELLFDSKRDPEGVAMCYTDPLTGIGIPCCPEGQGKCPLERRSESLWSCKVVVINGQYKEVRGLNKPKEAYFQCFKREGQSTSFWGYWNDKSKDPMYVDDFQCLAYEEAGIEHPPEETSIQFPLKFKSAYDNQSGKDHEKKL
ncbi:hypothetical protein GPALN_015008 [Globodera pallida]|nr:hypothetical protein GPALN_015008 [Globodera pallida]